MSPEDDAMVRGVVADWIRYKADADALLENEGQRRMLVAALESYDAPTDPLTLNALALDVVKQRAEHAGKPAQVLKLAGETAAQFQQTVTHLIKSDPTFAARIGGIVDEHGGNAATCETCGRTERSLLNQHDWMKLVTAQDLIFERSGLRTCPECFEKKPEASRPGWVSVIDV